MCKSSICPSAWVKMSWIQNRTTLSLNNFLKLEKVLIEEKKNFYQENSISGYCRFEIAGFTNRISNFGRNNLKFTHQVVRKFPNFTTFSIIPPKQQF